MPKDFNIGDYEEQIIYGENPSTSSKIIGYNIHTPLQNVWPKNGNQADIGGLKSYPAEINFFEFKLLKYNSAAPNWIVTRLEIEKDFIATKTTYVITVDSKYCG